MDGMARRLRLQLSSPVEGHGFVIDTPFNYFEIRSVFTGTHLGMQGRPRVVSHRGGNRGPQDKSRIGIIPAFCFALLCPTLRGLWTGY